MSNCQFGAYANLLALTRDLVSTHIKDTALTC